MTSREISNDQIPELTIKRVQDAHEPVWKNPDRWFIVAGPFSSQVARVYASQANAGTRWKSLIRPEIGSTIYKGWTDPEAVGEKRAYVLAMYHKGEDVA